MAHRNFASRVAQIAIITTITSVGSVSMVSGQRPRHARQPVFGVVAFDAYASGSTVDILFVNNDGQAKTLHHQRSLDGGISWGATTDIDTGLTPIGVASRGNGPQVVAHGEHVAVHWSTDGVDRHGSGPMATAYSSDGGQTWTSGPNPAEDGTRRGQNFADMAADPDGTFYVAWIGSHDGPARRALGVARSVDFGASWDYSQLADTSSCACCWNRIEAPRPGVARVLYRDHGIRDMALATTADGGRTWSLDGVVGEFGWAFDGCPHVGGGIATGGNSQAEQLHALVWTGHESKHGLYWVTSVDDGARWSTPRRFGGDFARHADIGARGNTVVAAWDESRRIRISTSDDAGETWSETKALSRDGYVASHPLVLRTDDQFVVFWTERDADGLVTWQSQRLDSPGTASTTDGQDQ